VILNIPLIAWAELGFNTRWRQKVIMIKTGSDFSGVGAFDQALSRLGITQNKMFACDMDKYARQTYIHNYGEPAYYPENVYDRAIPEESLDIYMTSPPCQSFSLAGKRKGEDSTNGVLFYNSHEFIVKNNPRYFIFENVKGLLSDNSGKTFKTWIDMLGGKTVNGNPVIFPHEQSVPYHVYYQVLNAKNYGVPQNRERVFIIGIRDDSDNEFSFPKPFHLVKRLKDVLESEVDEKYFLSDKMISGFVNKPTPGFENRFKPLDLNVLNANAITTSGGNQISDNYIKIGFINQDTQASQVYSEDGITPNICAGTHGYANGYVETKAGRIIGRNPENPKSRVAGLHTEQIVEINKDFSVTNTLTTVQKDNVVVIPANNSKGYDIAEEEEDSINFSNPKSETRRGRVGHGLAQTLDTACNQGVLVKQINPSKESGGVQPFQHNRVYEGDIVGTLDTECGRPSYVTPQRIRRLTPAECFRLMDFNDDFKWNVSDSQAYKQAGNSIVVSCLVQIISKLKL
jgi:DNA (cytosine-5)-methyltransferase 1